ncbi:MAG: GNAT family N-acetyltransferase [Bacillota bacterium]
MELTGQRLRLRRPSQADVEPRFRWYSDPEVTRYLPLAGKASIPKEEIAAYIARVSSSERPVLDFSIDLLDGTPIGACSLREFDRANRAEVSLIIGERSAWGCGYALESMRLLVNHGFADLGLHSLWLVVRADNHRAVTLYERLGFKHDGVMRASALVDGVYYDKYLMSVLAGEWSGGVGS